MTNNGTTETSRALQECNSVIESISKKANKYKRWARISGVLLVLIPASIPVALLVLPDPFSKAVSAILSAVLAGLGGWMGVEKPFERWSLYRRYHRAFEAERLRFQHKIGRYSEKNAESMLIEMLAEGQVRLHAEWEGLLPESSDVLNQLQTAGQIGGVP